MIINLRLVSVGVKPLSSITTKRNVNTLAGELTAPEK